MRSGAMRCPLNGIFTSYPHETRAIPVRNQLLEARRIAANIAKLPEPKAVMSVTEFLVPRR